ncbi:alpha/beta fold hydrolase [Nitriliruptor alkaliphilus]|uniref:alpha/beta fold hydrolase n=1 Tax=Nitriliruptor alkaliphilus TaxID=427918 RepID=UPI0006965B7F|nr:alpha/beta hydrolase [Nitriliruptor alkaliphilus]
MTEQATDRIRMLELADGSLEYEEWAATSVGADHPPLVLLHEGLGARALWRGFPAALHAATGRRMLVYSRHGYGRSAVVSRPRRVDYMHREADVVLPELLDRLGYDRPVLVGHSDGASIALLHAGRAERGVDRLVLLAPHVIVEDESIAGIEAAREAYRTTALPQRMARHHRDADTTFWGWNDIWLDPAFRSWDITGRLPRIDVPVLVVQGVDDEYGTPRQLELIERGIAGPFTGVLLDGCRHAPHLDQPEATLEAVVGFLAEGRAQAPSSRTSEP